MKKISLAVLAIVAICTSKVNSQSIEAKASFASEFGRAENVTWEKVNNKISLARFSENNESKLAYFDSDGKLLMQSRKISFANCPHLVQKSVNRIMESYRTKSGILQVVHTYEITEQDETRYYLNAGNANVQIALMSSTGGSCRVLKKVDLTPVSTTSILATGNK
jgi:hypothetical protein